jgi:hypothetical protein
MPQAKPFADLESSQVQRLEQWAAAGSTPQRVALRCRIVLLTTRGEPVAQIARRLDVQRPTVRLWRDRVAKEGIGAVWDIAPGRGRKPSYGKSRIAHLVKSTLQDKPKGSTHWSTRAMATAQGISKSTVQRIWDDHQLKPHLTRSFKLSKDPHFVEKLTEIIGVYLTPPQNAIVFCVDEKSQIQAFDRTQRGLPLKPGRCGTFTHHYKRHGTTTLFPNGLMGNSWRTHSTWLQNQQPPLQSLQHCWGMPTSGGTPHFRRWNALAGHFSIPYREAIIAMVALERAPAWG